jgi:hypothetical protein
MDNRAYKVDPYRGLDTPVRWWEQVGDTNKPSPYRKATWTYKKTIKVEQEVFGPGSVNVFFTTISVYDGKASYPFPLLGQGLNVGSPKLLGNLSYEINTGFLKITDWAHNNWHDAEPVRMAFKILLSSLPPCVTHISVKDEPTAFWRDLGFVYNEKGDGYLIYPFENPFQDIIAVPF